MAQCALAAGSSLEEPPTKRLKQQEVLPLFATATKAQLDDCVAEFFYGTGIPLHLSVGNSSCVPTVHSPVNVCCQKSLQSGCKRLIVIMRTRMRRSLRRRRRMTTEFSEQVL